MIILAAGFSGRMGVLKPLLPVRKLPAVVQNIYMAHAIGIREIIVVTGSRHEEIESVVCNYAPEVRCVYNENYKNGMFSSIQAGVQKLPAGLDGFFLLPADHCAVSQDLFATLIEVFRNTGGDMVVRPKYGDKRGHPPLIPAKFIAPLGAYSGEDGMRGFLNTCPFTAVLTDDRGVILDMDTPADYAQLLRYMNLPTYPNQDECRELLRKYETPKPVIEHCEQVEHVAQNLAARLKPGGLLLDTELLRAACLLHDVLRTEKNHALEGMKLLLREGYPDAAILVGDHMDGSGEFTGEITESEILFLADKLCRGGKISAIDETIAALRVKFAGNHEAFESAEKRMNRALAVFNTLCARYGIGLSDCGI